MSTTVLNKVNHNLGQMAKKFSHPYAGGVKSISTIKNLISLTTTKESVDASKEILSNVKGFIDVLPVNSIKLAQLKKEIAQTNGNLQFVNAILTDINNVIDHEGAEIKVDDVNMKTFIKNFKEIKISLLYISDYLNLILDSHGWKAEIKAGQYVDYTLDELLEKIKAA
jgi:hypothetical protein